MLLPGPSDVAVQDQLTSGALVRFPLRPPALRLRPVWRADRASVPGLREVLQTATA
ncbi:hypothetical protein ACIOJE_08005 [Kitasatospora sp. NPDC087861]|uniref:hypothetical protein n=1 Tax=Kitasatospora sp. NPDC087861 TaxID=3364070 RepID=UPI003816B98E